MRALLLIIIIYFGNFTENNPKNHFGDNYDYAVKFLKRKSNRINNIIEEWNGDKEVVFSVVFPELIRHSIWQDFIETKANELLYVKRGRPAAYFSIGKFQQKPTFAEKIENTIKNTPSLAYNYFDIYSYKGESIKEKRAERIKRLKSYKWQIKYVIAMCKIVEERFHFGPSVSPQDKIRFFCSAYNHDFLCDSVEIDHWSKKKTFPYGVRRSNPFSYADVAIYFYENDYTDSIK